MPLTTMSTFPKKRGSRVDAETAAARAIEALEDLAAPDEPMVLIYQEEREWCWLFPFTTVHSLTTGDLQDTLVTGPLVVPKNGASPWVAPSSPPVERWLNEYAKENELPELELPEVPDPFADADA